MVAGGSLVTRQEHAIAQARAERREELFPLRAEINEAIDRIGWRQAKPLVEAVLRKTYPDIHLSSQRGGWWGLVGKRNGPKLVAALQVAATKEVTGQQKLF